MSHQNFSNTFQSSNQIIKGGNDTGMAIIAEDPEQDAAMDIPNYHTLKLCLIGKAYSGKKTQAQMLHEKYGDKLTFFNMAEVLREALNFVNPALKEEVIDPKAKGGKGGKPAEAANDQFVGKDTAAYREVAANLLNEKIGRASCRERV